MITQGKFDKVVKTTFVIVTFQKVWWWTSTTSMNLWVPLPFPSPKTECISIDTSSQFGINGWQRNSYTLCYFIFRFFLLLYDSVTWLVLFPWVLKEGTEDFNNKTIDAFKNLWQTPVAREGCQVRTAFSPLQMISSTEFLLPWSPPCLFCVSGLHRERNYGSTRSSRSIITAIRFHFWVIFL